jgi:hypothetical protein
LGSSGSFGEPPRDTDAPVTGRPLVSQPHSTLGDFFATSELLLSGLQATMLPFVSRGSMCRMSENHEWRAYLELCWRMAQEASTESERCSWVDMAARWRLLIITQQEASIEQGEFYCSSERSSSDQLQAAEKILKLCRGLIQKPQRLVMKAFVAKSGFWSSAGLFAGPVAAANPQLRLDPAVGLASSETAAIPARGRTALRRLGRFMSKR